MKRILTAALILSLTAAMVSCGTAGTQNSDASGTDVLTEETSEAGTGATAGTAASDEAGAAAESTAAAAAQSAAEENVTVRIPKTYVNVSSQEEADEICKANGYVSVTLESDGSVTFVMSKASHDELVKEFENSAAQGISEIITSGYYENITAVTHNDDYSEFTVKVSGDSVSDTERLCADELVMYGTFYHFYSGNDVDRIKVSFVSDQSGEVLDTAESEDLTEYDAEAESPSASDADADQEKTSESDAGDAGSTGQESSEEEENS